MDRERALAKITKCLALSRSANPHEAGAALRQAQALMREHGITDADVALSDVKEAATRARCAGSNEWEARLGQLVADAFGCETFSLIDGRLIGARWRKQRDRVFVGINAAADVASYCYAVLAGQCATARLAHIAKQPKSCKPITKTARGDEFALGWVFGVQQIVERFVGAEGNRLLIEQYMAAKHPNLKTVTPRNTAVGRNVRRDDTLQGFRSGQAARLDRGLAAAQPQLLPAGEAHGR